MTDDFDESALFGASAAKKTSSNPLAKYYRVPGLNIKIPTNGAFMPEGSIKLVNGELPILPMRTADEMLLKSPDALMSGEAIESLLESCVPGLTDAKKISSPDLDVIILAIRVATYGETMEITSSCPKCKMENTFDCNLPHMLHDMSFIDAQNPVRLTDEIVVYLRPYTLETSTKMASAMYEETRKLQQIENSEDSIQKEQMKKSHQRMIDINMESMVDAVMSVTVPEGIETDRDNIRDFMSNIPRMWMKKIEEKLNEINSKGMNKNLHMNCVKCKHEWDAEVEFNPASFFDLGS